MNNSQTNQNIAVTGIVTSMVLVIIAFGGGLFLGRDIAYRQVSDVVSEQYDSVYIGELLDLIEEEHIGDFPDRPELTYGLAKGLIASLDDQYSAFLDPSEAEEYLNQSDSAYEGIGVQLGFDGQYTTVMTPIDGLPGQKAGLLEGDLILAVDEEDVAGMRPELVATRIRGEAGTNVEISIYRPKKSKLIDFSIKREAIDLENMSFEWLEDGVVLIDIVKFTEGGEGNLSGVQVFNATWDRIVGEILAKQKPKGIVLDLRNNPGGFVAAVEYVAEDFLKTGDVILRERQNLQPEVVTNSSRTGRFEGIPVVILVNGGSASASEILAAAVRDNGQGVVIGTKTVGKGVEQSLTRLSDGSIVLLVFKQWLTPDGVQIDSDNPIIPEPIIEFDPESDIDVQLDKAIEILND